MATFYRPADNRAWTMSCGEERLLIQRPAARSMGDQMSDLAADHGPGSASSPPKPPDDTPLPTAHKRSWRKILTPLVLAVLGLALLLAAFELYPKTTQRPSPSSANVGILVDSPLQSITYGVDPAGQGKARMTIELTLAGNLPPGGSFVGMSVTLPPGTTFVCSSSTCNKHSRTVGLSFKRARKAIRAKAEFPIKADSFGVDYNGVTASAAIPEIFYRGSGTPTLYAAYTIPSASSYDWSSYPPESVSESGAVWNEGVSLGDNLARTAVGINHAAQANDNTMTFIAGALLGLAGGALLSAVQEALHAGD